MIDWPGLRRLFRLGRAQDVEREVDEELRFHFDLKVKELMAAGMSERACLPVDPFDPAPGRRGVAQAVAAMSGDAIL